MKKCLLLIIMLLSMTVAAMAQSMKVSGTVKDASGAPVVGAMVIEDGTGNGAMVGAEGEWSMTVPADAVLTVSCLGYAEAKISVNGRAVIDVVLEEDRQVLDEVLVVAFGTTKKEAFTGSAAVVKSDDITKSQSSTVAGALAGKVAGVQVTSSSGQPGSGPDIRIRGFGSLNAGQSPLWIVDGMPFSGDLNNLNPSDIESMTVLKDAASNALYGARGANGVIMVTTKKAHSKDVIIKLDAKLGINTRATRDYEYISNPAVYYETHYNALKNYYLDQGKSSSEAHQIAASTVGASSNDGGLGYMVYDLPKGETIIGLNGKLNPNAVLGRNVVYDGVEYHVTPDDWTKEAYRTSLRQEYNVSAASSADRLSFFASFGYLNDQGIVRNSDMTRYTARLKADCNAKSWLTLGMQANYTNFYYNSISGGDASSSGNIFAYTTRIGPIYPLYIRDAEGNIMKDERGMDRYDYGNGDNAGMERSLFPNSNAVAETQLDKSVSEGNAFTGSGYFDIIFLPELKFTFSAGVVLDETRGTSVQNPYYGQFASQNGIVSKGHSRLFDHNLQQILNYTRAFGRHNLNAMLGHEYYRSESKSVGGSKSNMFSQENDELSGAITDMQAAYSTSSMYNNEGFFSRVMYDYDSRYYASGSFRRDASSRFAPGHRWGNFWSLGAAWIMSKENFMQGTTGWLDNLKYKFSIGSQGNDSIGNYRYIDTYSIENANGVISTVFSTKGNPDITWETNTNLNTGFEFGFLRGRIFGSLEYFMRKTSDMLLSFPVAPSMGYTSYYANVGDMVNQGVETELNFMPVSRRNLEWNINLNLTHLRNRITMLPQERRNMTVDGYEGYVSGTTFYGEGLPIYTFYMQKYAGVDENGRSLWYKDDEDGNRVTTTEYAEAGQYLCGNPIPAVNGGFGTLLSFYGVNLGIDLTYQVGGLSYDSGYESAMYSPANKDTGLNWHKDILKAWSPENKGSNIPRLMYEDQNQNATSDRFLMDASYLNLQNISMSYNFPSKMVNAMKLSRLKVYMQAQNVWYWSRRRGFDPRQSYNGGTTSANYSPVRTVSFGLEIQF
ncbi:MAG: TonB-dependent receptor [Bacteroidales bacterium]|nr:TonB-dependent receptor [Bacteroidales bacterium]